LATSDFEGSVTLAFFATRLACASPFLRRQTPLGSTGTTEVLTGSTFSQLRTFAAAALQKVTTLAEAHESQCDELAPILLRIVAMAASVDSVADVRNTADKAKAALLTTSAGRGRAVNPLLTSAAAVALRGAAAFLSENPARLESVPCWIERYFSSRVGKSSLRCAEAPESFREQLAADVLAASEVLAAGLRGVVVWRSPDRDRPTADSALTRPVVWIPRGTSDAATKATLDITLAPLATCLHYVDLVVDARFAEAHSATQRAVPVHPGSRLAGLVWAAQRWATWCSLSSRLQRGGFTDLERVRQCLDEARRSRPSGLLGYFTPSAALSEALSQSEIELARGFKLLHDAEAKGSGRL
jgi:hypothetical protein